MQAARISREIKQQKHRAVRDGGASTEGKLMSRCELKVQVCLGHKLEKSLDVDLAVKSLCIRRVYMQRPQFQAALTVGPQQVNVSLCMN